MDEAAVPAGARSHDIELERAFEPSHRSKILRISRIMTPASCVVLLLSGIVFPASATDVRRPQDWHFSVREDAGQVLSTRSLIILGAGGLLTLGAHAIEDADKQEKAFDGLGGVPDFGNHYGSPQAIVGGAASLLVAGLATDHPTITTVGVDLARSYAYSTTVVGAMKIVFNRTRPDGKNYSFPSGHSSAAFAAAPVITHHFGKVAGALAYACAGATLMGRMEDRKHYLSDVVFGATVGLLMGEAVVGQRREIARRVKLEPQRISVTFEF
jgi:membrane-associated phospholipid phosphatase